MEYVLMIACVAIALGFAFEGKEKPSNLPTFTKDEARRYYESEFLQNKD